MNRCTSKSNQIGNVFISFFTFYYSVPISGSLSIHSRFVRRLLFFYKPSSKLYAGLALDHSKARLLTVVGCQFVEFLMDSDEVSEGIVHLHIPTVHT